MKLWYLPCSRHSSIMLCLVLLWSLSWCIAFLWNKVSICFYYPYFLPIMIATLHIVRSRRPERGSRSRSQVTSQSRRLRVESGHTRVDREVTTRAGHSHHTESILSLSQKSQPANFLGGKVEKIVTQQREYSCVLMEEYRFYWWCQSVLILDFQNLQL